MFVPLGQLERARCSMVTQLHESKMRLQNQAPLHVLTDTHTHGRCCNNGKLFLMTPSGWKSLPQQEGAGQSWATSRDAALGLIKHPGNVYRPHGTIQGTCTGLMKARKVSQADLGWAQYFGSDHKQDFDPFSPLLCWYWCRRTKWTRVCPSILL